MVRVTLGGDELVGLERGDPGSSVRLLLPRDDGRFELPSWHGNEFLWSDGVRARIRTLTPLAVRDDGTSAELDVDIVLHDDAPLTRWADAVTAGSPAAVSGTGSGYAIDSAVASYVFFADESAVPAVCTILAELPSTATAVVHLERRASAEQADLTTHPGATITWAALPDGATPGDTLVSAAHEVGLDADTRVWAAGEAAAVQRIRKLMFDERGVPRSHATIRGYWKSGREGT
jgi:NADPH-dependent ferric siderophore reductase